MAKTLKPLWKSKTFWVAILQAVAGVLVAGPAENPTLGGLMIAKAILDIVIRYLTIKPVML